MEEARVILFLTVNVLGWITLGVLIVLFSTGVATAIENGYKRIRNWIVKGKY